MTVDDLIDTLDEAVVLEPRALWDKAVIGVAYRADGMRVLAYSAHLCLAALVADGMSEQEAMDWFYFNVNCAWTGPGTPVFIDYDIPEKGATQ